MSKSRNKKIAKELIRMRNKLTKSFNPYSPGFSIYLVYLLDILIRSISSKLFDT